ncbi:cobyrinic acid a,c-diamide synthase [Fibrobacteria bacterium R8-3-H12]
MKIVSIINYKGGVGKTTVTANLAGQLAYSGKKVLLIDMDAQASLTFSFIAPDEWDKSFKDNKTIKNWFDCISQSKPIIPIADIIIKPAKVNNMLKQQGKSGEIALISSHLGLLNVDLDLATLLAGANMEQSKMKYIKVHGNLRKELKKISETEYDIILIDCPPNFNIVTKNAIVASDLILVPAKPDYLSTLGIEYLQKSVNKLVKDYNEYSQYGNEREESIDPQILGVVFTMIQIYNGAPIQSQQQFISQTKRSKNMPVPVFDNYIITNNTIYADAPQTGIPVILNSYSNTSHSANVSQIRDFAEEFASKVGL